MDTNCAKLRAGKVNPVISVVIPVYNQEKYIGKCIRSVLGQSFQDFEVIIVNDGSTDKSLRMCQQYMKKDSRIFIIIKQNEGQAQARKDGSLKAKGKYLCFLDGDDYLPNDALETLYRLAEDSGADMTVGNCDRVFDNWGLVKKKSISFPKPDRLIGKNEIVPFILQKGEGYDQASSVVTMRLYRRTCVLRALEESVYPLFPHIRLIEDCIFNLAIAPFLESVRVTDVVVYHYRYGGMTARYYPQVRNASLFHNYSFDCCIREGYESLLPSLLKVYLYMLLSDVVGQLHFLVYSNEEICAFVRHELETRQIVLWAQENVEKVPDEMKREKLVRSVLNKDVDEFLAVAIEWEKFQRKHHYWKMSLAGFYQKVVDRMC